MAVGLGTSLLVALVWKISIRVAFVAGAVVILVLNFGPGTVMPIMHRLERGIGIGSIDSDYASSEAAVR